MRCCRSNKLKICCQWQMNLTEGRYLSASHQSLYYYFMFPILLDNTLSLILRLEQLHNTAYSHTTLQRKAAEELVMAQRARAALADDVTSLQLQQAELPARQQLEAGSAPIATVLPSVEGGEEVCL